MNTKTMEQLRTLDVETLSQVTGAGIPNGWHAPFGYMSNNIICKNGYRYNSENMKNGNCAINWESVVNDIVSNAVVAFVGGVARIP